MSIMSVNGVRKEMMNIMDTAVSAILTYNVTMVGKFNCWSTVQIGSIKKQ